MGLSGREREIVSTLVDSKAVDFEAIGKTLATYGPTMALDMDYEDGFCGTLRYFVRVYRPWVTGQQPGVEQLGGAVGGELQG